MNNRTPLFKFSPREDVVAIASGSKVYIYSTDGSVIDTIDTSNQNVLDIVWSSEGSYLAILAEHSHIIHIWLAAQRSQSKLALDVEEPVSICWGRRQAILYIGTSQGHLFIYNTFSSARTPIMSKHQKRIFSITTTPMSDFVASLSPEAFNVSNVSGTTVAFLRQKSLGCLFLGRITQTSIKIGDGEPMDAVAIPVYYNQAVAKKMKIDAPFQKDGIYILILNIDQRQVYQSGQPTDLFANLKAQTYGNCYTQIPQSNDMDTIIDMSFQDQAINGIQNISVLMSSGVVYNITLDHSRQALALSTADGKFKYGTVVGRREPQFVTTCFGSYIQLIEEMNSGLFNLVDCCMGHNQFQSIIERSLTPCTSVHVLKSIQRSTKLLVPYDKSINQYDTASMQDTEKVFLDFSGGKNSLGNVSNFPTNIAMSETGGSFALVSFSNGASIMLLTKSISVNFKSIIEDVFTLPCNISDNPNISSHPPINQNPGMHIAKLVSPKVIHLQKLTPCDTTGPLIQQYKNEVKLPFEPQRFCINQQAFGLINDINVSWTNISSDDAGNLSFTWYSIQQKAVSHFSLVNCGGAQIACLRTTDGSVVLNAGGGVQTMIDTQNVGKIQTIKACSPFLYCISEKSVLVIYNLDLDGEDITYNKVAQVSLPNEFDNTSAKAHNDPDGSTMIDISPGGSCVIVYKKNKKSSPCVFFPAEEVLLRDVFDESYQIREVIFDSTLLNVFVCILTDGPADGLKYTGVVTGSALFHVADKEGPGVQYTYTKFAQAKDFTSVPSLVSNGIALNIGSDSIQDSEPVPGISNLHLSMTSLQLAKPKKVPAATDFIKLQNPIQPIDNSVVTIVNQDSETETIQIQLAREQTFFPDYRRIPHPSLQTSMTKAVVELCNLGQTYLASQFALRLQKSELIKLVADHSLKYIDYDTALTCYNELALMQVLSPTYDADMAEYVNFWMTDKYEGRFEYLAAIDRSEFLKVLSTPNLTHNNDPAALSLFINKICIQETDINTCMAYALLLACPEAEKDTQNIAEAILDAAERLLLKSNRPGLALSFRVDSLDWNTASVLAKKISSPYVRAEIMIQQAGELEAKNMHQDAIDICTAIASSENGRLDLQTVPPHIQPMFIGIMSRCYCAQGKIQETKEFALPPRQKGKFIQRPRDPLNILQRCRLCFDCAEMLSSQKRFVDSGIFYEASANLSQFCFGNLSKELNKIGTGETSLYDIVYGDAAEKMLLFQLLPNLKLKAQSNYDVMIGNKKDDAYDIQLLRNLDQSVEQAQKKIVNSTLPQKIADIITAADISELEYTLLLSKAANSYIKGRQYDAAELLIEFVSDKATIADLARVFMRDDPEKALMLFKRAGKSIEIVECLLAMKKYQEAESAVKEVKIQMEKAIASKQPGLEAMILDMENEFRQSSLLLAQFFRKANGPKKAIVYYIQAESYDEAFDLAVATKNEDLLIKFVTGKAPQEFLRKAAKYFAQPDPESQEKKPRNLSAAARFLELSGSVDNAIKLLLNYGDGASDIDKAIDLLKQARGMVDYVLKYLQGGADGVKKNPLYIFKLYLALDKFQDAAKTSYILVNREIEHARYGKAKQILVTSYLKLKAAAGSVPAKFRTLMNLMHAVDIGKRFTSLNLHLQAATCLYRAYKVAKSFGDQACSIVLSACVECSRAGDEFKREAYECACVLLKEYEEEIPDKYRKPVEGIVRKFKKGTESKHSQLLCCQCGEPVQAGILECDACHAVLPMDCATGNQILLSDFCECPHCNHTCSRLGLYEIYSTDQIKAFETKCLMCEKTFDLNQVLVVDQSNYQLINGGKFAWEEYEYRPLIVYEDSNLARKRYEEWVRIWYTEKAE